VYVGDHRECFASSVIRSAGAIRGGVANADDGEPVSLTPVAITGSYPAMLAPSRMNPQILRAYESIEPAK
jgi:hypothetical protein